MHTARFSRTRVFVFVSLLVGAAVSLGPAAHAEVRPIVTPAVLLHPAYARHRLIVAANLGTAQRATTGTLVGFGYDSTIATTAALDVRYAGPMGGCSECLSHGFAVGYTYSAGPTFGVLHDAAFRLHIGDASYLARVEFPCMRREHRRVHLSGLFGPTGIYADAGLGDVPRNNTDLINDRTLAATRYDHFAVGWHLGLSLDFTFDSMLVGLGVDLREAWGVGTPLAHTFMAGASLRIGFDAGLGATAPRRSISW